MTPYCILEQLLRRLENGPFLLDFPSVRNCAETFVALATTEYSFLTGSPCLIAVSSLVTALRSLANSNSNLNFAGLLRGVLSLTRLSFEVVMATVAKIEETVLRYKMQSGEYTNNNNAVMTGDENNVENVAKNSPNRPNLKRKSPAGSTPTEMKTISADINMS